MVASGKNGACDGPEPKCGSKMMWGGLCGVCYLVGIILLIVAFTSTICVCGDNSWCKDPDGCISGGAWWALVIFGSISITLANVFVCGVCACCCFAPEGAAATGPAVAQAAPVAAPAVAAPDAK